MLYNNSRNLAALCSLWCCAPQRAQRRNKPLKSGDLLLRKSGEKQLRKIDDFYLLFTSCH